jgi:hypothetical protein
MTTYSVEVKLTDFYIMEAQDKMEAASLVESLAAEEFGLEVTDVEILNVKEID